jgi:hypothetical protein
MEKKLILKQHFVLLSFQQSLDLHCFILLPNHQWCQYRPDVDIFPHCSYVFCCDDKNEGRAPLLVSSVRIFYDRTGLSPLDQSLGRHRLNPFMNNLLEKKSVHYMVAYELYITINNCYGMVSMHQYQISKFICV